MRSGNARKVDRCPFSVESREDFSCLFSQKELLSDNLTKGGGQLRICAQPGPSAKACGSTAHAEVLDQNPAQQADGVSGQKTSTAPLRRAGCEET